MKKVDPSQDLFADFATFLGNLARPEAFPFAVHEAIPVIQTHGSAVLLTSDRAYKLKKPENFGFFDYSTPEFRRHFCIQEVSLNARLAPQVYLGVAPVLAYTDGHVSFGSTLPPEALPHPDTEMDGGRVIDYAVVMVRLPEELTLAAKVQAGTATPVHLREVARRMVAFHAASATDEHIATFGSLEVIRGNWEENFVQTQPYVDRLLDRATYDRVAHYIHHFIEGHTALFVGRVEDTHIRDCHGDLRLQHIYLPDMQRDCLHEIAIIDCIEFNERFRYSDVASEVAFLVMELDHAGRSDLSQAFLDAYVATSGDTAIYELIPFYACYRAYVRGKVLAFQIDQPEVPATQREAVHQQAEALFALAASYAQGPTKPLLMLVGGLMGTGKSILATALQHKQGWELFSSDTIRKQLAQVDPAEPQSAEFSQGLYSHEWTVRTYSTLIAEATSVLAQGRSVLLDASFARRSDRQKAALAAKACGASAVFIECVCPRDTALERLSQRWEGRLDGHQTGADSSSYASDGRPALYDAQHTTWEAFTADEEPDVEHILLTTTAPLATTVEQVLNALAAPLS